MADVRGAKTDLGPVDAWLQAAGTDAERRGLADLKPLLETLAQATRRLRAAGWNSRVPADARRPTADGGATPRDAQEKA